jgi:hypothetical protein
MNMRIYATGKYQHTGCVYMLIGLKIEVAANDADAVIFNKNIGHNIISGAYDPPVFNEY